MGGAAVRRLFAVSGLFQEGGGLVEYITVKQQGQDEFLEKKSRFIGTCRPVRTEEEALAFIEEMKKRYWDASHNVYAYVLREGGIQRFSDDGEPQGKAGIPVIESLKKSGVADAVVVATRYFGGTLLGGGGLIRAYSHTATIGIAAAQRVIMRECLLLRVDCDYSLYGKVQGAIPENGGVVDGTEFLERVAIHFHLPPEELPALAKRLADATGGKASVREEGSRFFQFPYGA